MNMILWQNSGMSQTLQLF